MGPIQGPKQARAKWRILANCVTDSLLSNQTLHYRSSPAFAIIHHTSVRNSDCLGLLHTLLLTLAITSTHITLPQKHSPLTMSEFLQIAQVLADLSSLQNTVRPPLTRAISSPAPLPSTSSHTPSQEPTAAQNLLAANKSLSPGTLRRKSKEALLPEPAKFDKFGRRILRTPATLSRANLSFSASSVPNSAASSGAATPTAGGSLEEVCASPLSLPNFYVVYISK